MTWADIPRNPPAKTLRQFAAIWLLVFSGLAAYQAWFHHRPGWGLALAVLACGVGLLGLVCPRAVRPIFVGWMMVAFPIGWVVSHLMLVLMFFGILTPLALVLRLKGRDLLCRKPAPDRSSFWIPKTMPPDVRRYFRQF